MSTLSDDIGLTLSVPTLYTAITDFRDTKFNDFSDDIRRRYMMAFNHFLLDKHHGDIPLTFENVKRRIVERKAKCTLADSTRQKVLYKLVRFLDYCVGCGWLERNPMSVIGIALCDRDGAKLRDDQNVPTYSVEEVSAILSWLRDNEYPRVAEYVEFLFLTGVRPKEGIRTRWDEMTDTYVTIHAKRVRGRRSELRYLPLRAEDGDEVRPGLIDLLERLRKQENVNGGLLFPWRTISSVQPTFLKCRRALGITNGRSLKTFRSTASWPYKEVLRWSAEFRCEYLGHSLAVNVRYYDNQRTDDEMVRLASHRRV